MNLTKITLPRKTDVDNSKKTVKIYNLDMIIVWYRKNISAKVMQELAYKEYDNLKLERINYINLISIKFYRF